MHFTNLVIKFTGLIQVIIKYVGTKFCFLGTKHLLFFFESSLVGEVITSHLNPTSVPDTVLHYLFPLFDLNSFVKVFPCLSFFKFIGDIWDAVLEKNREFVG